MKTLRVLRRIACILLVIVLGTLAYQVTVLRRFYRGSEALFPMPGVEDSRYDEQGIAYDAETDSLLFTGYMRDGTADPVYVVDRTTGERRHTVRLLNMDGSAFTGHAGGLAVSGRFVYIAGSSDCCLYVYDREELMAAGNEGRIRCIGVFPTAISAEDGVKVSFVSTDDGILYVGEFHLPLIPQYQLRANHRVRTELGETSAILAGFRIDENARLGLESRPCVVYTLPDRVQGAVVRGDHVLLSRSFGLTPSTLSDNEMLPAGEFELMGASVPMYILRETRSVSIPPMSEEIETVDGDVYIASELDNMLLPGFGRLWGSDYLRAWKGWNE